jgi:long-chain fatty acid transport protein
MDDDDQDHQRITTVSSQGDYNMGCLRSLLKIFAISFLVSEAFFTLPAFAAGFQINEVSASLQGDATAGAAAASNDVSSMFINPATLSTLQQNQVYLGGSELIPSVSMSNAKAIHTANIPGIPPSSISATVLGQNSQNSIGQSAFVPDGYIGWHINNELVAGLAILAPYGLTTHYHENSVLRFAAEYSAVRSIDINPALAYSINDQWAVGVGFQAQYLRAIFSNFNGPYIGMSAIDALIAANNPTYLKGDGWGYGYTMGVLFKPDLYTRIGLGFRSQISQQIRGNGQQYTMPGGTVPAPSQDFPFNAETSVRAGVKTPAVLTLSAARDISPAWTVKASVQLNFWDSFNQLSINMPNAFATNSTIQTKWRNPWFGALGADYRATPEWTLRGGVAYDQTPTTGLRDPRIPDNNRIWFAIGTSYKLDKHLSIDGAYEYIYIQDQTVNVTQASGSSANSTVPLEVNQVYAKYKSSANILALAVRFSF